MFCPPTLPNNSYCGTRAGKLKFYRSGKRAPLDLWVLLPVLRAKYAKTICSIILCIEVICLLCQLKEHFILRSRTSDQNRTPQTPRTSRWFVKDEPRLRNHSFMYQLRFYDSVWMERPDFALLLTN